jgi:hypothetical protein
MTFGVALKIHQQNQANDVMVKSTTRHWPGLAQRENPAHHQNGL